MQKGQIESESKNIAEYFRKYWASYADPYFDSTFSLRNWATITASLVLHYNKNKSNKKSDNDKKINNIKNDNYENRLIKLFKNKKILHIGCGYGYFLEVVKELGAVPYGIEPYCSFPGNLGIIKAKIEDLQDNSSELSKKLKNGKFDAIVAHDMFLFSILIDKENAHKIVKTLKKYLNKNGIMVFENMNEEMLLEKTQIEKMGFEAECIDNIANPYGRVCSQVLIDRCSTILPQSLLIQK